MYQIHHVRRHFFEEKGPIISHIFLLAAVDYSMNKKYAYAYYKCWHGFLSQLFFPPRFYLFTLIAAKEKNHLKKSVVQSRHLEWCRTMIGLSFVKRERKKKLAFYLNFSTCWKASDKRKLLKRRTRHTADILLFFLFPIHLLMNSSSQFFDGKARKRQKGKPVAVERFCFVGVVWRHRKNEAIGCRELPAFWFRNKRAEAPSFAHSEHVDLARPSPMSSHTHTHMADCGQRIMADWRRITRPDSISNVSVSHPSLSCYSVK